MGDSHERSRYFQNLLFFNYSRPLMIYLLFRQNINFIYKVRASFIMQRTFYTYSVWEVHASIKIVPHRFTHIDKLHLTYWLYNWENIIHALPWTQRARAVRGIFPITQKEIIHKCSGNSYIIIYQHVAQMKDVNDYQSSLRPTCQESAG